MITVRIRKYMYDQNIYGLPLLFICILIYEYQSIENINIFAGDILAINNLLTKL